MNFFIPISSRGRRLAVIFSILFVLILCGSGVVVYKYIQIQKNGINAEWGGTPSVVPGPQVALGQKFSVHVPVQIPWGTTPGKPEVLIGEGIQFYEAPIIRRKKFGWGISQWQIEIPVQAFRLGKLSCGSLSIQMNGPKEPKVLSVKLPDMTVEEPAGVLLKEPVLAGEIIPQNIMSRKNLLIWICSGVLILLILIVFFVFIRSKRKQIELQKTVSIWDAALTSIRSLRGMVREKNITPERGLADLTDIVRHYLENRFLLRAEHQTTAEFLTELERDTRLLTTDNRRFLKSFLSVADLVKFAKMPADLTVFEKASSSAEDLISGTADQPGQSAEQGGKA